MSQLGVVIVSAGKGTRMKSSISKQYLLLNGKQVLIHTLEAFQAVEEVIEIVLVVGADEVSTCEQAIETYQLSKVKIVLAGGRERQDSVFIGLQALSDNINWVMIHDGVRPLIKQEHIQHLYQQAKAMGAAVLAVPVKETIKMVDPHNNITATPERSLLWSIQTPQAFSRETIMKAHQLAEREQFLGTDDSMLVERMGLAVHVVEGDYTNIKITTPDDLAWAEFLIKERIQHD